MKKLRGIYSQANGFSQLMILLFIAFSSALLLIGLMYIVLWFIYRPASAEAFSDLLVQNVALLKGAQAVQDFGLFIFPAFIAAFLFSSRPADYLSLRNASRARLYFFVALSIVAAFPLINGLVTLNEQLRLPPFLQHVEQWMREMETDNQLLTERFLSVSTLSGLAINLLLIGALAALSEELIFRGVLQRIFTRWTKSATIGIWLTAFIFSAIHLQFYGFLPRLLLGAYFGYLLVWTRSLWIPIAAHFVHNSAAVLAFYVYSNHQTEINPDEIGTTSTWWLSVLSLLLFAGVVAVIKRNLKNEKN